ncbi:MAG: hypothetical protein HGB11_05535, partial [Chlorobiales bacterium]|nr:hypothetical protein [Chlorobiales bacterium]
MSDQESSTLVFFVPGIMGSTLRRSGIGEHGQPIDDEIWSTDIWRNRTILATNVGALASRAEPGEVIHFLSFGIVKYPIYGTLIEFCTNHERGLGLKEGENFFTFPYDWRKDNFETAEKLASFIKSKNDSRNRNILIIAHSMGGIVSRIMLLNDKQVAERTDFFVQIASPVTGSAKAYFTLKERPSIGKYFDKTWTTKH